MEQRRSEKAALDFQGLVGFHRGVEVEHEKDDELREVAEVGPVVLICVDEGQINDVVHEVGKADGENKQTLVVLFVSGRHVKTEGHSIEDADGDVGPRHPVHLELALELAIAVVIEELQTQKSNEAEDDGRNCSGSTQSIVFGVLGCRVLEVQAGRESDVEAVEDEDSQKDFLEENVANFGEFGDFTREKDDEK